MPLVNIDMRKNPDPLFGRRIGEVVHEALVRAINIPESDKFQIIREYDENHLVYTKDHMGIPRSDSLVMITIYLSEGRTRERKLELYRLIADNLNAKLGVRREDVYTSLVEVNKENWSAGNGEAQYI